MLIFYFLLLDYQEKMDEWSLKSLYFFFSLFILFYFFYYFFLGGNALFAHLFRNHSTLRAVSLSYSAKNPQSFAFPSSDWQSLPRIQTGPNPVSYQLQISLGIKIFLCFETGTLSLVINIEKMVLLWISYDK